LFVELERNFHIRRRELRSPEQEAQQQPAATTAAAER
jgi:hypothetical protein